LSKEIIIDMKTLANNKKAYFSYFIKDEYIAGIKLLGSEVKPIKNGDVSIKESYCYIKDGEVFIKGMFISHSKTTSVKLNHETTRVRKLLLNKREINKISDKLEQKGLTLVPLLVGLSKEGYIKVKLGVCKGKKLYDKKNVLKEKESNLEIKRQSKNY